VMSELRDDEGVVYFDDGGVVHAAIRSKPGAMPPAGIDSVIEQARALDMNKVRAEIAEAEAQGGGNVKP